MTDEEWRDIPGWEGFYQASSLGRIKSVEHMGGGKMKPHTVRERIRKLQTRMKGGRVMTNVLLLYRDGGYKAGHPARLVYSAFHGPIPWNGKIVHVDGDATNNSINNLRMVTSQVEIEQIKVSRGLRGKAAAAGGRAGVGGDQAGRAGVPQDHLDQQERSQEGGDVQHRREPQPELSQPVDAQLDQPEQGEAV